MVTAMNSPSPYTPAPHPVTVTDIDIPFGRMVVLILKFMLASIPAVILMYAIMAAVGLLAFGLLGGLGALTQHLKLPN